MTLIISDDIKHDISVIEANYRQKVVAVVFDDDGVVIEHCFTWQTGQNFALSEGKRVLAVADDGFMVVANAQKLYDADRDRYNDCFGKE